MNYSSSNVPIKRHFLLKGFCKSFQRYKVRGKNESEVEEDISSLQRHTKLGGNVIGDGGLGRISPSTADVENVAAVAWRIYFAKDSDRLGKDVKACSVFLRVP